jgi:superfamily II DNA or RNA helicase
MRPVEERDYQTRIIQKTVDGFTVNRYKSILIESPTGSGKTIMGLLALKQIKERWKDMTFGWVAMRRKLLEQAQAENERIGVTDIKFVSMFDNNPPKCDLMVTDEAQHDSARTCADLHKVTGARLSLGMTATPFRTDRIKLGYEKIIRDCGVRFLIEQGYLSPFRHFIMDEFTPTSVTSLFLQDPEKWGKSVIYMRTQAECEHVANALNKGGVPAAVLLGSHPLSMRNEMFDDFENGKLQALVNIYLLTEGFDAPDLKTAWVRDASKLPTIQMAGRCLRKDPNDPSKVAQIVQSHKPLAYPYSKVAKASCEYILINNEWYGLEPGPEVDALIEAVRTRLWTKPVNLPAYLEGGRGPNFRVSHSKKTNVTKVITIKQKVRKNAKKSAFSDLFVEPDENDA